MDDNYQEEPTQRIPLLADQPVNEDLDPTDPGPYTLEREGDSEEEPDESEQEESTADSEQDPVE
jgi:hypothetical protein